MAAVCVDDICARFPAKNSLVEFAETLFRRLWLGGARSVCFLGSLHMPWARDASKVYTWNADIDSNPLLRLHAPAEFDVAQPLNDAALGTYMHVAQVLGFDVSLVAIVGKRTTNSPEARERLAHLSLSLVPADGIQASFRLSQVAKLAFESIRIDQPPKQDEQATNEDDVADDVSVNMMFM
jgi:hypothetical protein